MNSCLLDETTFLICFHYRTTSPYLGDIFNTFDNIASINDTVVLVLTMDVPSGSSIPFTIFAMTMYNTSSGEMQLVDELDFFIIQPEINVTTEALSVR